MIFQRILLARQWRISRAAVVHLNFRAGSTFPVPVCTVPSSMDWTSGCNKVVAVRLYASYRLNFLLLKGQRCVMYPIIIYHSSEKGEKENFGIGPTHLLELGH